MSKEPHHLFVDIDHAGDRYCLRVKAVGKLTREDYSQLRQQMETALAEVESPRLNVLFDATEMTGWDLRAAWEDTLLGFQHADEFDKVAIHGNREWQEIAASSADWFVPGKVKFFDNREEALAWLAC